MEVAIWKPSVEIRNTMAQTAGRISGPLRDRLQRLMETKGNCFLECLIAILYIKSSAAHIKYIFESERYSSFPAEEDWSQIGNGQTVRSFVEAGFFLVEQACDHVKCFFCNLGLKDWSAGDDPLFEHARFSPLCFYIKSMKGLQYLEEVSTRHSESVRFPPVYRQPDHGGLLIKIINLWKSDAATAVTSVGMNANDVLLRVSRVWIRERRFENVEDLVVVLQDNMDYQQRDELDLFKIVEDYYKFYTRNQHQATASASGASSRSKSPKHENTTQSGSIRSKTVNYQEEGNKARLGAAAASVPASAPNPAPSTQKTEKDCQSVTQRRSKMCIVCDKRELSMTCLPCSHLCMCHLCSQKTRTCPSCSTPIVTFVRTYLT